MNNITEKYNNLIDSYMEQVPPMEERKRIIEEINEQHLQETGENLPNFLLEKLGTWLLKEVYSDKRTNKTALEEFPLLSEHQLLRRQRRVSLINDESKLSNLKFHIDNNSRNSFNKVDSKRAGVVNE